jgi:hypothetical protein
MKKINIIVACFLLIVFCLTSCKDNNSSDTPIDKLPDTVIETEDWLIKDGNTDYYILIPKDSTDEEKLAAQELQYFFMLATGFSLETKNEPSNPSEKYISLGETEVKKNNGLSLNYEKYGVDSFSLKTINKNIYIYGSSIYGNGVIYGVYEFLSIMFDYEYYYVDEIKIDDTKSKKFYELDYSSQPDIEGRLGCLGYAETGLNMYRYRYDDFHQVWSNKLSPYHNSFLYFPATTYAEGHPDCFSGEQLDYTANGNEEEYNFMLNTIAGAFEKEIDSKQDQDVLRFAFTAEDNEGWSTSNASKTVIDKYGARSATLILFLNDLSDKLNAYVHENNINTKIELATFAYFATLEAPVKTNSAGEYYVEDEDIILRDNVYILFAPLGADTSVSLKSDTNKGFYENIKKWSFISKKLGFWTYSTNFSDYFAPYDWWTALKENICLIAEKDTFMFLNQDGKNTLYSPTCFGTLRGYLVSKLSWNADLDIKDLEDDFFGNYFKNASTPMKKLYDSLKMKLLYEYKTNNYTGSYLSAASTKYFDYGDITLWKGYLSEAYDCVDFLKTIDIALYNKLYKRITLESLMVRYLDITIFGDKYPQSELYEMKVSFRKDCDLTDFSMYKESVSISELYSLWGI